MKTLNVKQWTIIILSILGLINGFHSGISNTLPQLVMAVLSTLLSNTIIDLVLTKKFKISESAIITGLIIGEVAAPNSSLAVIALLSTIAIGSKYLFQINKRTVFNPAAFSLIIGLFFFNVTMGWWGDYYSFLTIVAGSILFIKLNGHWHMVFVFLGTLVLLTILRSLVLSLPIIDQLYSNIGISFFFSFFMLTDPKTTPVFPYQLWKFSIIAAVGTMLSIQFLPSTVLIGGLLLANLLTPYINYRELKRIQEAAKRPGPPNAMPVAPA